MAQHKSDNALLIRCFSLWERDIGRRDRVGHTITFFIVFVGFVLMVFIGVMVAMQLSVAVGAGILLPTFFCAILLDLMSGCNLVKQDSDWPSDERKAAISRFVCSLKSEGEFEASDLSSLIILVDEQETLIDERIRGLQSLVDVVAAGLFGEICSQAMSLDNPVEGASLQETIGLIVLLGIALVALLTATAKATQRFLDKCIWMSRSDLSSCGEALRLASMSCFADCWIGGVSIGKHVRRT